ncbi:hypothetical protein F5877DRAFT_93634 [Lentinula edodes]|nr:hypothetical protein F5877DRAFT_93634 [Lentinula edodes]
MNLWTKGEEDAYAVRHGSKSVSDFGQPRKGEECTEEERPNYFEHAFPILFPYGQGGIEANRPVAIPFHEHIQWTLHYHDRRFRIHQTFPFALSSARVQMRRKTFEAEARLMSSITKEALEKADQLWSTTIYLTPPSLWITINPCDLHDPIAQVFAGESIDMDAFEATMGPNKEVRAKDIADDPYAAAKFFHFIIQAILRTLFGVQVTPYRIKSSEGIFGRVRSYFGAVESQDPDSPMYKAELQDLE